MEGQTVPNASGLPAPEDHPRRPQPASGGSGLTVVYDGACPFCTAYVRLVRLREACGPVTLVDARSGHPVVGAIAAAGFDLDSGMVVEMDGNYYHGDRAMHVLSLLTTRSGAFNGAVRWLFRSPRVARLVYPALVAGRNATLRLLGRGRLR